MDDLAALGAQYAEEVENLAQLIAACGLRRAAALQTGDMPAARRQERLAFAHAQQRADLLRIAAQLRQYYDDDGKR